MASRPGELAEHTEVHLLPRYGFETIDRDGYVYLAGEQNANVHAYRVDDVEAAVTWARDESRRRGHADVEWWVGWTAVPRELGPRLAALGLSRSDDPSTLTGTTCSTAPPAAPSGAVRRVETLEEYLAMVEVDVRAVVVRPARPRGAPAARP